jgi:hypothetical protein
MPEYLLCGANGLAHVAQCSRDRPAKNPPTGPWQSALGQYRVQDSSKQVYRLVGFAIGIWEDQVHRAYSYGKRQWQTVLTPWFAEILPRVFGCCLGQVG